MYSPTTHTKTKKSLNPSLSLSQNSPQPPPRQLEALRERDSEDELDDTADTEPAEDSSDENLDDWENDENIAPLPIHNDNNNANNNDDDNVEDSPPKSSARRTLKNMFTSLMGWRKQNQLPKGTRDYYAARESLGEEMRAFRRDTMPRLMERAASKDGPKRPRRPEQQQQQQQREKREFDRLIGSPRRKGAEVPPASSIATIKPIYGSSKAGQAQHRLSRSLPADDFLMGPLAKPRVVAQPRSHYAVGVLFFIVLGVCMRGENILYRISMDCLESSLY